MKIITIFLISFLLFSCSNDQFSFKQYQEFPVKFNSKQIQSLDGSFELKIPNKWKYKIEDYEDIKEITSGLEIVSKTEGKNHIDIMSVQKGIGFSSSKNLKKEFEKIVEIQKNNSILKVLESGKTDFLNNESYFVHSRSNSGNYGELESITIITQNSEDGTFYYLTAGASRTKDINRNMSIMLNCLKSFKQK